MTHGEVHVAAELTADTLDKWDKGVNKLKYGTRVAKAISVTQAFRKYSWLKLAPIVNKAGNYRGIILSSHWNTVYQVTSEAYSAVEKYSGIIGNTAAIATGLVSTWDEVDEIVHSNRDTATKAAMLSTQVSSAALRTAFAASDMAIVSPLLTGLAYSCGAMNNALGGHIAFLQQCQSRVSNSNSGITTSFMNLTDGKNIYNYIQVNLVYN